MRYLIINGPNLNLLGRREPGIYGNSSFDEVLADVRSRHSDVTIDYYQSNHEGDIIDTCLLYTSPSPRDRVISRMPSSA